MAQKQDLERILFFSDFHSICFPTEDPQTGKPVIVEGAGKYNAVSEIAAHLKKEAEETKAYRLSAVLDGGDMFDAKLGSQVLVQQLQADLQEMAKTDENEAKKFNEFLSVMLEINSIEAQFGEGGLEKLMNDPKVNPEAKKKLQEAQQLLLAGEEKYKGRFENALEKVNELEKLTAQRKRAWSQTMNKELGLVVYNAFGNHDSIFGIQEFLGAEFKESNNAQLVDLSSADMKEKLSNGEAIYCVDNHILKTKGGHRIGGATNLIGTGPAALLRHGRYPHLYDEDEIAVMKGEKDPKTTKAYERITSQPLDILLTHYAMGTGAYDHSQSVTAAMKANKTIRHNLGGHVHHSKTVGLSSELGRDENNPAAATAVSHNEVLALDYAKDKNGHTYVAGGEKFILIGEDILKAHDQNMYEAALQGQKGDYEIKDGLFLEGDTGTLEWISKNKGNPKLEQQGYKLEGNPVQEKVQKYFVVRKQLTQAEIDDMNGQGKQYQSQQKDAQQYDVAQKRQQQQVREPQTV